MIYVLRRQWHEINAAATITPAHKHYTHTHIRMHVYMHVNKYMCVCIHFLIVQLTRWLPAVVPVAIVAADVVASPMDPTLFFFWKLSMTEFMSCISAVSTSCKKPDICTKFNEPMSKKYTLILTPQRVSTHYT